MRLAHLSDIHVLDLTGIRAYRFANKRITGGLNLLLKRSKHHDEALLHAALTQIESLRCDHVLVSGDLTNLALDTEFAKARRILESHVPETRLSVIAGNHDRYTLGSVITRRFERHFEPYIRTDLPGAATVRGWPWVKFPADGVALIGVNSAVAQPWLVSGGRVGRKQRVALAEILRHPSVADRFKIVALHHHLFKPPHKKREFPRGLIDRAAVLETLCAGGVDMVLHGHNHHYVVKPVARPDGGTLLVCEAGSTTVAHYSDDVFAGKFNIYEVDGEGIARLETWIWRDDAFVPWKTWTFEDPAAPTPHDA